MQYSHHILPKISIKNLNLLDFKILNRIQFFSTNSFGFEKRDQTLYELREDISEEMTYQKNLNNDLKKYISEIHENPKFQSNFLHILKMYDAYGFFFIKRFFTRLITILDYIDLYNNKYFITNKNEMQFVENIKESGIGHLLELNVLFQDTTFLKQFIKYVLPLYFSSNRKTPEKLKQFRLYYNLLNLSFKLRIFDLHQLQRIIEIPHELDLIYQKKEEKLDEIYKKLDLEKVSRKDVEDKLAIYLETEPSLIRPLLVNTFPFPSMVFNRYYFLLEKNKKVLQKLKVIMRHFPKSYYYIVRDMNSSKESIYAFLETPNLYYKQEYELITILYNIFNGDIICANRCPSQGFTPVFSLDSFYDFQKSEFFYSEALFTQKKRLILNILGNSFQPISEAESFPRHLFLSKNEDLNKLAKKIKDFDQRANIDFSTKTLKSLVDFINSLSDHLKNINLFSGHKQEYFFSNYVKSIKFIPAFQRFGLDQYYLYICPTEMSEIDFKLLFLNTFQKIMYPASLDNPLPFFIKYIMPHRSPNTKYLNWLIHSKKIIREMCQFRVKKIYSLLHTTFSLEESGWRYDVDKFKRHIDNILFNPDYIFQAPITNQFNMNNGSLIAKYQVESPEFKSLERLFNRTSIDIKTYYVPRNKDLVNDFLSLMEKELVFPYPTLKNLDFRDKFYIILPDIKKEDVNKLVQIFSYFNYGFIYEIEGDYYITGFDEQRSFEYGLMIKLYFPETILFQFLEKSSLLFQYLGIRHYFFLFNYMNGKEFLKSIYDGLEFVDKYNPLKNLIWSKKDKKWINHKLFTEKFEKLYPPLNYGNMKNYDNIFLE